MYPSAPNGVPKLKIRVPQIERLCSDGDSLDKKTRAHLRMVFDRFLELVMEDSSLFESSTYNHTKTFSPIELTAVCCLLSQHGEQRPIGMLRGDVRLLRDHLRQRHTELRSGEAHWATCWRYIDDLEAIRGAVDQGTMASARAVPIPQVARQQQTPQSAGAKRGRKPADNDGDEDFRPSAMAKRNGASGRLPRQTARPVSYDISAHAAGQTQQDARAKESSSSSSGDSDSEPERVARLAKAPVALMGDGQTARKRALMDLGGSDVSVFRLLIASFALSCELQDVPRENPAFTERESTDSEIINRAHEILRRKRPESWQLVSRRNCLRGRSQDRSKSVYARCYGWTTNHLLDLLSCKHDSVSTAMLGLRFRRACIINH